MKELVLTYFCVCFFVMLTVGLFGPMNTLSSPLHGVISIIIIIIASLIYNLFDCILMFLTMGV